jgi:hypothetical protein
MEGSCEHGNEPLASIKCWEIVAAQLAAFQEGLSPMELVRNAVQISSGTSIISSGISYGFLNLSRRISLLHLKTCHIASFHMFSNSAFFKHLIISRYNILPTDSTV